MIQTISTITPLVKIKASQLVKKMTSKMSGDSQIVVALVLIAVAIGLCIIFRNTIFDVMSNLFTTIKSQIKDLSSGQVVS